MKKQTYKTKLKRDHWLFENYYVRQRIVMISEKLLGKTSTVDAYNFIIVSEAYPEDYRTFKEFIERRYEGLCEFDV